MRLPAGLEWACPGTSQVWCVREVGADRTLCGLSFYTRSGASGFCPAEQPEGFPSPLCGACMEVVFGERP